MIIFIKYYKSGMNIEKAFYEQKKKWTETCGEEEISVRTLEGFSDRYKIFPGFCDVHVHFREPGFSYKETIRSGTESAARGGYTAVCTMPNLNPVPDSPERLGVQTEIIKKDAVIEVFPYGAISVDEKGKELSKMEEISSKVIGFSDDGKGVQDAEIMEKAMMEAKRLNKIIAAHCEDEKLLCGGYVHDGVYARNNGHKGISSESEWKMIERDLALASKTGVKYHICHVSTKESVELIRKAKKSGTDVTAETAPHYLIFDDNMIKDDGRYKMNPPIRGEEDREALIKGILDGTIDMIATDHAPHSPNEKCGGLKGSLNGIVGLETAFPVLYTFLVKKGIIGLEKLIELMSVNPRKRFGLKNINGYCVWDTEKEYAINAEEFLSKGRSTPFEGMKVYGRCVLTEYNGKTVYKDKEYR